MRSPSLSVVVIAGNSPRKASRLLKSLSEQTIAGEMEAVVVSLAADCGRTPALPAGFRARMIHHPGSTEWGRARAEAARQAEAPIVAYLEDHTIPAKDWAERVLEAFERADRNLTAVSFTFVNGSPDTWFYRSVFMAEYGSLSHPMPEGAAPAMAANNIAYRREALLEMGEELDALIEMDFFLQRAMGDKFRIATAPKAIVAHETNTTLFDLVPGHFRYAELFSNRRVKVEKWGTLKRLAGAVAAPLLVPPLRLKRLFGALAGRPQMKDAIAALPLILLLYVSASFGESMGVLRSGQLSAKDMLWLELEADRAAR